MKITALVLLSLPLITYAQKPLKINKAQSFSLKQDETKLFGIQFEKGKSYQVVVEQKGIDVELRLIHANGKEAAHMDSPNGKYGPEIIDLTIQNNTDFTLSVTPLKDAANALQGKCSVLFRESINPDNTSPITQLLTPKEMKEDLQVFRKIREQANSGFLRYRTPEQTDSLYRWAFAHIQKPLSIVEFDKIVMTLTDFEGSNHNATKLPFHPAYYIPQDKGYFPFFMVNINNQFIVDSDEAPIPLGAQILSINGIPDKELQKRFSKYCTTDGYNQTAKDNASIKRSFGWNLPFELGTYDHFDVTFKRHGSETIEEIRLPSISRAENRASYMKRHSMPFDNSTDYNVQEKYSFRRINSETGLLNFRIFTMASNAEDPDFLQFSNYLDSLFLSFKMEKLQNLIIDIRNNPGGNDPTYEKVFTYLTNDSFKENTGAYILFKSLPYPQYYKWNSSDKGNQKRELIELNDYLSTTFSVKKNGWYYQDQQFNPTYYPDSNRFKGSIFLLINEDVGSAASHFASLVRGHSNATIVGMETSGGYYGHNGHFPVEYELPNSKIITRFSIVHVTQDAPQKDSQPIGHGIIPDRKVSQSYDDFIQNEDTQIKYILKLIEERK